MPGQDLVTNLDARVQSTAEQALAAAVAGARKRGDRADSAAAVVLDVTNGAVVAAASYPSYDPQVWTGGVSADEFARLTAPAAGTPLVSRVTSAAFSPASTFKVVSLPAAVAAGNSLGGTYDCTSGYTIGNRTFANFESRAYGPISLRQAVEVSCDTIFYDFAYRSWLAQGGLAAKSDARDPFVEMADRFGLGRLTGIDLPGEQAGRIPDRQWKQRQWEETRVQTCKRARSGYPEVGATDPSRAAYLKQLAVENCRTGFQFRAGDAANFAIGQGDITVTPLQMAQVYAAIANGGTLWKPEVARALATPGGASQRIAPVKAGTVRLPAGDPRLPARRPRGRRHERHRPRRLRRLPARPVAGGGQDGHRRGFRQAGHLLVRVLRPDHQAPVCRRGRGLPGRHRRRGGGACGPRDPRRPAHPEVGTQAGWARWGAAADSQ